MWRGSCRRTAPPPGRPPRRGATGRRRGGWAAMSARSSRARRRPPPGTGGEGRGPPPAGNAWRGDVAVRSGPVMVGGRVEGTLLVINGDAVLDTTAVITGDLIVVGGTVARARGAAVSGQVRIYQEPLAFRAKGDEIALVPPDLRRWFRNLGVEKSWGTQDSRSSLTLATGGTFNRVEGLPVVFGPLFDWKLHRNLRLRVDARGAADGRGAPRVTGAPKRRGGPPQPADRRRALHRAQRQREFRYAQ